MHRDCGPHARFRLNGHSCSDNPRAFLDTDQTQSAAMRLGVEAFPSVGDDQPQTFRVASEFDANMRSTCMFHSVAQRFLRDSVQSSGGVKGNRLGDISFTECNDEVFLPVDVFDECSQRRCETEILENCRMKPVRYLANVFRQLTQAGLESPEAYLRLFAGWFRGHSGHRRCPFRSVRAAGSHRRAIPSQFFCVPSPVR